MEGTFKEFATVQSFVYYFYSRADSRLRLCVCRFRLSSSHAMCYAAVLKQSCKTTDASMMTMLMYYMKMTNRYSYCHLGA